MIHDIWEFWDLDTWGDDTWGEATPAGFNPAWAINANQVVSYYGEQE